MRWRMLLFTFSQRGQSALLFFNMSEEASVMLDIGVNPPTIKMNKDNTETKSQVEVL